MGSKKCQAHGATTSPPPTAAAESVANTSAPRRSSLADFQSWMTAAGITWDSSLIEMRAGDPPHTTPIPTSGALPAAATDPLPATDLHQTPSEPAAIPPEAPWAVYAVRSIPAGAVLASLPRAVCLSAASCGLADILAAERLGGGLALVAAVMYEAARGPKSKWYNYLSSLPAREYLPVFWSPAQLTALTGTDLEAKALEDRAAMASDFSTQLAPLLDRYPKRLGPLAAGWTLEAFMRAASWVASRAFYVDERHGDALVPLADVFNHKAARVELRGGDWAADFVVAEHADAQRQTRAGDRQGSGGRGAAGSAGREQSEEVEEEEAVEGEDGDGGTSCDSDAGDEEEEEEEEAEEEISEEESEEGTDGGRRRRQRAPVEDLDVDPGDDGKDPWGPPPPPPPLVPHADLESRRLPQRAGGGGGGDDGGLYGLQGRWRLLAEGAAARGGPNLHLDIGICALERGDCEVLDIVAAQPLSGGAEVYNTYGEHGNAELVNKYGFALPHNPFDELAIDKPALLEAAKATVGRKAAAKRARFLEQHSELLSPDSEPFLLLPPRHVSTPLYLALRLLTATDKELGGWTSLEEVVAPLREAWRQQQQQEQQQKEQQVSSVAEGQTVHGATEKAAVNGEHAGGGERATKRRRIVEETAEVRDGVEGGGGEGVEGQQSAKRCLVSGSDGKAVSGGKAGNRGGSSGRKTESVDVDDEDEVRDVTGAEKDTGHSSRGDVGDFKDGDDVSGVEEEDKEDNEGEEEEDDDDDLPEDVEIQNLTGSVSVKGTTFSTSTTGSGAAGPLWTPAMGSLLRQVILQRLAAYPTTRHQDEQELLVGQPHAAAPPTLLSHASQQQPQQQGADASAGAAGPRYQRGGGRKRGHNKEVKGGGVNDMAGAGRGTPSISVLGCNAAEAAAAWRCALVLRLGEKRLLEAVVEALGE